MNANSDMCGQLQQKEATVKQTKESKKENSRHVVFMIGFISSCKIGQTGTKKKKEKTEVSSKEAGSCWWRYSMLTHGCLPLFMETLHRSEDNQNRAH